MSDLTPRQTQILRLIQNAISESGMPPTRAEIARTLGFKSPNAAEEHLRALQRKGVIDLIPGASRGIQLKDILREQLGLPLIGRVAAGRPIWSPCTALPKCAIVKLWSPVWKTKSPSNAIGRKARLCGCCLKMPILNPFESISRNS